MIALRPLRLLQIEDSAGDAALIELEIRRAGFDAAITRVESAAEMRVQLRTRTWDLVISDHTLPASSSIETLAVLQEAAIDVPFLIVSGTIGEEAAVAAMKAGASDYLLKDRLGRLGAVIERELTQAAQRKRGRAAEAHLADAEAEALRESEERLSVFEVLHELAAASSGVIDVARLADLTVRGALQLVAGDNAVLRWWDAESGVLRLIGATDRRELTRKTDLAPGSSILGEAFLTRKSMVVNDYQRHSKAVPVWRSDGVTALVAVPLMVEGRAVGALGVVSNGHRRFTESDAGILGFLGAQIAASIAAARLRADLVDSLAEFAGAFEGSGVGMSMISPEGTYLRVNAALCALLGYQRDELMAKPARDLMHEPDFTPSLDEFRRVMAGGAAKYVVEGRYKHRDGHLIWCRLHMSMIRAQDGQVKFIVSQVEDISMSLAAVAELTASEARHSAVINAALDAMVVIDAEGKVTTFNPAAERMFGFSSEQVIGCDLVEMLAPERFRAADRRAIRGNVSADLEGLARRFELIALRSDGTEFPIEVSMSRLETDGSPFFSGSIRDLTNRDQLAESQLQLAKVIAAAPVILFACDAMGTVKLAEGRGLLSLRVGDGLVVGSNVFEVLVGIPEAVEHVRRGLAGESFVGTIRLESVDLWLETSYDPIRDDVGTVVGMVALATDISDRVRADDARQESEAKSRLVAIVNHEVRSPLNSIIGFTELLKLERVGPLNEKQKRYVTNVESAGLHLLALVNDSLDLSKIAAGKMELELVAIAVGPIVEEAAGQVQPLLDSNGLEIEVVVGADITVMADRRRLLQIIWNLLSNAIRHTPAGGKIGIECRRAAKTVEIVVTDSGVGMAASQLGRIFDDYTQIGVKADGTGLGLPVSRRLAQLMGGDIDVRSELGTGSSFTISIPAAQTPRRDR